MRLIRGFALRYVMPNDEIALLLLKNGYKKTWHGLCFSISEVQKNVSKAIRPREAPKTSRLFKSLIFMNPFGGTL